eukprot:TRINITY_DN4213_c0_g1_i2.p2 TRINITY_DN4213_c0_g1~~TRINITY_DN4213_c0_g1_i2.p2  ORF type:complete len:153 (+),score=15.54 TRINITY_DN4213_c0_g1_i2:243-701(+)
MHGSLLSDDATKSMNDSSDISTNVNKPRSALKLGYADIDRVDSQPRHESMGLNEVTRFGKFTIFWINKQESNKLYDLVIELPFNCNVKTCINQAVNYLNEKMNKENSPYRLKNEASMYGLHYAKKNGQPKSDYPRKPQSSLALTANLRSILR